MVGAIQPRTGANGTPAEDGYALVLKGFITEDSLNDGLNEGQALDIKLKSADGISKGQVLEFGDGAGQVGLVNTVGKVWGDYSNQLSLKADRVGTHKAVTR